VAAEEKSVVATLQELKELTIAYAKQETVDPLKGMGRFLGFGLLGAVLTAIGGLFLSLALLRAMQPEFHGNVSWFPYSVTVVLLVVFSVAAGLAIKGKDKR
jgi:hypothetical protein